MKIKVKIQVSDWSRRGDYVLSNYNVTYNLIVFLIIS